MEIPNGASGGRTGSSASVLLKHGVTRFALTPSTWARKISRMSKSCRSLASMVQVCRAQLSEKNRTACRLNWSDAQESAVKVERMVAQKTPAFEARSCHGCVTMVAAVSLCSTPNLSETLATHHRGPHRFAKGATGLPHSLSSRTSLGHGRLRVELGANPTERLSTSMLPVVLCILASTSIDVLEASSGLHVFFFSRAAMRAEASSSPAHTFKRFSSTQHHPP